MLRPISRKYDSRPNTPTRSNSKRWRISSKGSRRQRLSRSPEHEAFRDGEGKEEKHNGANMSALLNALEITLG